MIGLGNSIHAVTEQQKTSYSNLSYKFLEQSYRNGGGEADIKFNRHFCLLLQ